MPEFAPLCTLKVEVADPFDFGMTPGVMVRLARGEQVDPKLYYFRTVLGFETGAASLDWLNWIIAIASAVRTRSLVDLEAFELR